ncbi:MAG: hypothetical protein QW348_08760 [Ignisphaera sp.]
MELGIKDFLWDFAIAIPLFIYVMLIVSIVTKRLYDYMVGRGVKRNVAVYYNRKIIHVSTGGRGQSAWLWLVPQVQILSQTLFASATWGTRYH